MTRITIKEIIKKKGKKKIPCLTAYSKTVAEVLDKYCDIILVGDSLGMVLYGNKSTSHRCANCLQFAYQHMTATKL